MAKQEKPYVDDPVVGKTPLPKVITKAMLDQAFDLDAEGKECAKTLKDIKATIVDVIDSDSVIVYPGVGTVPVVNKFEPVIENEQRLAEILGSRFDDFVETRVAYKAKDNLREIMNDEDHPLHDLIKDCTCFKHSCQVSFKPQK